MAGKHIYIHTYIHTYRYIQADTIRERQACIHPGIHAYIHPYRQAH